MSDLVHNNMYSSSSSDDEEIIEYITRVRRTTNIRVDKFIINEIQFVSRYRISKATTLVILGYLRRRVPLMNTKNNALSVLEQLLITLRFYATGSVQQIVAEAANTHKSTVCRAIHQISKALASLAPRYIFMPRNENEMSEVSYEFYRLANFPRVIGAIDCTHIPIQSPGGTTAELYRNRKSFFSLNVQTVVDARLKIRDIVCRWPGSVHDTTIYDNSCIKSRLDSGEFGNRYFIGDGGYQQLYNLMIPFRTPITRPQTDYNKSHITTRNTVERAYGVWKRRFPCLFLKLRVRRAKAEAIIVAAAVLHNICRDYNEPDIDYPQFSAEEHGSDLEYRTTVQGNIVRNELVTNFFSIPNQQ